MEIIPEVKLVSEAQPRDRDTIGQVVLFSLSNLGRKHILMAQSIAEGIQFLIILISNPQIWPISG